MPVPTLDLLLPGLFPAQAVSDTGSPPPRLPMLERLLARSDFSTLEETSACRWLLRRFGFDADGEMPAGALSLASDGGTPGDACWLRADPVHLRVQRDQLLLADHHVFDISQSEAEALTDALNRHFAADGMVFYPLRPERWYLRTSTLPAIVTTPLAEAIGRGIDPLLPRGPEAMAWHRLGNEIQMLLHGTPQNADRESRGAPTINSVWLWGAGVMPRHVARPYALVIGEDPVAGGLARAAACGLRTVGGDLRTLLAQGLRGDALWYDTKLDRLRVYGDEAAVTAELQDLEQRLFAPVLDALSRGQLDRVRLVTFAADRGIAFEARRADLWRFWRSARALAEYAPR
jgi:hypothetical protein